MNERIKKVRELRKLSQAEFAEKLKLQRNSISRIENGSRNASERTISDICEVFNVNEKWLKTGQGDMFKAELKINENLQDIMSIFNELAPELQEYVALQTKNLLATQQKLQATQESK